MNYNQKYKKYKEKYLNLVKSLQGGMLSPAPEPPLLKIYLQKNLSWNDNGNLSEEFDDKDYNRLRELNQIEDPSYYIYNIDQKSWKGLEQLRKNYELKIISMDEYNEQKKINFNNFTWNNYDLWVNVFINSKPSFDKIRNKNTLQKITLSKDKTYQLFNDKFKFFNKVLIPFINRHYNQSLDNLDTWLNCDQDTLRQIKNDTNNCYGTRINIPDDSKIIVIGDIHSSFTTLRHIFNDLISKETYFIDRTLKLQKNKYLIFTGDIIDYGPYGLECLWFVFTLLYHNPENVIILKGNHENESQYTNFRQPGLSFNTQLNEQLKDQKIKKLIKNILGLLPTVIFVKFRNETYQYNHGSIDFDIAGFDDEIETFGPDKKSSIREFINHPDINKNKLLISLSNTKKNNTYQWGDFYYNPNSITDINDYNGKRIQNYEPYLKKKELAHIGSNKSDFLKYLKMEDKTRPKHNFYLINDYLYMNNIKCIISGHQDNVALGILPSDEKKIEIDIGGNEKLRYSKDDNLIVTPYAYDDTLKNDRYEIILKPMDDFYAVTLSTAVHSKYVNYATYGVLG